MVPPPQGRSNLAGEGPFKNPFFLYHIVLCGENLFDEKIRLRASRHLNRSRESPPINKFHVLSAFLDFG